MQVALGFVKELRSPPGLRDALEGLQRQGISACVASQAPRPRVELALQITGLASVFEDRVFTAAMVPRSKPHPDVFLYAAARMGAEPTRCVVIEDSPSGIRAAVAAGMRVLGYAADEDAAALERAGAQRTFHAMSELPALLERLPADSHDVAPNAAPRVRLAYETFASRDPRSLFDLLSEEVVYHLPGQHLGGGILRGRAEVFARMSAAAQSLDEPATILIQGVTGFGEWVLTTERFTARRRARVLDQDACVVWRIVDGRCVEMWSRFCDQASCDRFWRA
jgi:ketosteroid isomerase-like protein